MCLDRTGCLPNLKVQPPAVLLVPKLRLGNPVGKLQLPETHFHVGTWKRINQQPIGSTEHPLPASRPSITRHASKPLPCSPGIMPALPNRDGKPLTATVYPAGNGEYCPRFMAVPSARGRTRHLRLRDPRKRPASCCQIGEPELRYTAFQVLHGQGNHCLSGKSRFEQASGVIGTLQVFAQDRKPVSGLGGRQSPATH